MSKKQKKTSKTRQILMDFDTGEILSTYNITKNDKIAISGYYIKSFPRFNKEGLNYKYEGYLSHIIEQTILPKDTNDETIVLAIVKDLAEQIAFKLRRREQVSNRVQLEIHYSDGYKRFALGAIDYIDDYSVINIFKKLFFRANKRRNRIRAILVDLCDFSPYVEQINFFDNIQDINLDLSRSIEKIRSKYGVSSLQTANILQALKQV